MGAGDDRGLASMLVVLAGGVWGVYWVPVRALSAAGLGGPAGSLVVVAAALALLLPLAALRARRLAADPWAVAATACGGVSFMLYSVGLVEGRIGAVILLFYLTPVWTTVLGFGLFGWTVPRLRYVVIALGLGGLALVLGGDGGVPVPREPGEWLGLIAGLLWSLASLGMRVRGELPPLAATTVFAAGAVVAGILLYAGFSAAPPVAPPPARATIGGAWLVAWVLAGALLWWIGAMLALVWAAARLAPARVGILLMSEVLVGVVSAALFAGEPMSAMQLLGAALLIAGGLLDVFSG